MMASLMLELNMKPEGTAKSGNIPNDLNEAA
jgi:hypothetical protein